MQKEVKVLDHGHVRLVDHMGGDLAISRAARVSYDAEWRAGEDEGSDRRLIHYLWKNKHTTPFEAVEFQFDIMAPIFVIRQWHRHRTWTYNELSARYRELPEKYYIPKAHHVGVQSASSKQARDLVTAKDWFVYLQLMDVQNKMAFSLYRQLIEEGMPRELARSVLPLSTYTHMFAKVNLRNLFHFIELRYDPHAQYEIRVYARAMLELIRPIVPVAVEAFENGKTFPADAD
jgi:thymidylate synthase (FAD)